MICFTICGVDLLGVSRFLRRELGRWDYFIFLTVEVLLSAASLYVVLWLSLLGTGTILCVPG